MSDHEVVQTSTAQFPRDNGWLVYYCSSCKGVPTVCAASFSHGDRFDSEGYSTALDVFNMAHPHRDVLVSKWAQ